MFHKNLLILVFLLNLGIILSTNDCDSITNAQDKKVCTNVKLSNSKKYPDYCCFYEQMDDDTAKKFCRTVPYSSFYEEETYENINDHLYKVTCKSDEGAKTYLEQSFEYLPIKSIFSKLGRGSYRYILFSSISL